MKNKKGRKKKVTAQTVRKRERMYGGERKERLLPAVEEWSQKRGFGLECGAVTVYTRESCCLHFAKCALHPRWRVFFSSSSFFFFFLFRQTPCSFLSLLLGPMYKRRFPRKRSESQKKWMCMRARRNCAHYTANSPAERIRKRTDIWVLFHPYTLCECSGLDIAHTNVELNIHWELIVLVRL